MIISNLQNSNNREHSNVANADILLRATINLRIIAKLEICIISKNNRCLKFEQRLLKSYSLPYPVKNGSKVRPLNKIILKDLLENRIFNSFLHQTMKT